MMVIFTNFIKILYEFSNTVFVPKENHRPVAGHWKTLSHNVVLSTPRHEQGSNSQLKWW
jgi:hypothetical protein